MYDDGEALENCRLQLEKGENNLAHINKMLTSPNMFLFCGADVERIRRNRNKKEIEIRQI